MLAAVVAFNVQAPLLPRAGAAVRARTLAPRCGFEIESVTQDAVDEMGVMTWPGLEKRDAPFSQNAGADELLMCYVKDGSATLTDAEESGTVSAGQMVMVSDGDVQWSDISEGGLTLISATTQMSDVASDEKDEDEVEDLNPKEAVILLGAGLLAGGLFSFGFNTFMAGGG